MKKGLWITIGVIVAIVLIFGLWLMGSYNRFVTLEQNVNSKWSEVENQYQRQADLIPNLISVVSSSVKVETQFVKDVTAARTAYASASNQLAKDIAGQQMNNGISALVSAVAENYPTLQANKQYIALTDELAGTQNRIAVARGSYIQSIQLFNTAVKRFPANIVAGMFGFYSKEYYQANNSSMQTPALGTGQLP
jgi:LemA protein